MKRRTQKLAVLMALALASSFPVLSGAEEAATEAADGQEGAEAATEAADGQEGAEAAPQAADSQVASADEMVTPEDVVDEDMVPVYGKDIADGAYEVEVRSSSSMFRVVGCELTVEDGEMTAVMTMSSDGYLKLYMGTGQEAVAALEEDWIPGEVNEEGQTVFEVPVEALDMGIDCAAFSKKKEKWYDRTLVFTAASLPTEARKDLELTTAASLDLEDGTYLVEVALSGGSGKTTVETPTTLTVAEGEMTVLVTFSSSNYDYVLVGEEKYLPVNTEGNSAFRIPVDGMDYEMPITADTVAMSTPHEIEYTLYFDSLTIAEREEP